MASQWAMLELAVGAELAVALTLLFPWSKDILTEVLGVVGLTFKLLFLIVPFSAFKLLGLRLGLGEGEQMTEYSARFYNAQDLGKLLNSQPPVELKLIPRTTEMDPNPEEFEMEPRFTQLNYDGKREEIGNPEQVEAIKRGLKACKVWRRKKIEQGFPQFQCSFPFLIGAPKLVQCGVCQNVVYPEEEILCSVRGCRGVFHLTCAKESLDFSSSHPFKCPQHGKPFVGGILLIGVWRKRMANRVDISLVTMQHLVPSNNMEHIFSLLPLPYNEEEFKIDVNWRDQAETKWDVHSYVQINRNMYLIKRKRNNVDTDTGCTNCSSTQCSDGCECSVSSILEMELNEFPRFSVSAAQKLAFALKSVQTDPFRKRKKFRLSRYFLLSECSPYFWLLCPAANNTMYVDYQTELCGWGVVAAESISKGDFIIEYVGEVIDDAICEGRLWDMKDHDAKNFYMCEINKNFVIDATFKGNSSRFLNHSCAPNCKLEKCTEDSGFIFVTLLPKRQVEGETRVGVFASRSIEVGEPLTYDYRYAALVVDLLLFI
ncbi:hypothetical protein RD792_014962 [Penstemon davidsonii]|uniref:SET domain-containing protein n=1 Tax=Penstemon davidsonii TaxID=160366 RepID=A0ABR0CQR0_9LAMI|nr:hypothetical protein RD792_014962 [Penstemon davidsonii]